MLSSNFNVVLDDFATKIAIYFILTVAIVEVQLCLLLFKGTRENLTRTMNVACFANESPNLVYPKLHTVNLSIMVTLVFHNDDFSVFNLAFF
jgi:hypothetical protein